MLARAWGFESLRPHHVIQVAGLRIGTIRAPSGAVAKLAKAPVSKTGDSRFESWLPRSSPAFRRVNAGPIPPVSLVSGPASVEGAGGMVVRWTTALGVALATLLLLLAIALAPSNASAAQCKGGDDPPAKVSDKRAAKAVYCLLNKERRSHGLRPLHRQKSQTRAALEHNRKMIKSRCFSHQCAGEKDLVGRLTSAKYLPCNCSWGVGENLAYGSGGSASPRSIVDAWMHSAEHRANILNGGFQHIGVAVSSGTPSAGRTRDGATFTTDFGYRR